ncbi:MAG: hypothetical protein KDF60_20070, partial [Calditrichaeota bacterium]|nr:hypothetical protein [Calditrichota bacterium]
IYANWIGPRINKKSKFNFLYQFTYYPSIKGLNDLCSKYYKKNIRELDDKELTNLLANLDRISMQVN